MTAPCVASTLPYLNTSPTSTSSVNTASINNAISDEDHHENYWEVDMESYWKNDRHRKFIIKSYQPSNVKNKSSSIHKSFVNAADEADDNVLTASKDIRTYCVPGADCSIVYNETVFSLAPKSGRLRLDSLARVQDVFFDDDGQMTFKSVDIVEYEEETDDGEMHEDDIQGRWTHDQSTTEEEDGAGILKFDKRGFYCFEPHGPSRQSSWVIHADLSLIEKRPEGRCFQVDLITFPPSSNNRPYLYGKD